MEAVASSLPSEDVDSGMSAMLSGGDCLLLGQRGRKAELQQTAHLE